MANFLSNIRAVAWTTCLLGLVFLIAYGVGVQKFGIADPIYVSAFLRWTHVVAGIMWIGHLYYFNFTQIPNVQKIPEEHRGPAISKVIAPAALFWFRWGAVATLVTGVLLAANQGYLIQAYTLGLADGFAVPKHIFIGIGMWLATIMFINVWFVIWPNQQRALNIDNAYPDLSKDDRAKHARTAMLFSRTNTLLSVPMLVAMTGAQTLG
ncbi:MAG: urate hydroxylase PuuD [Alphaproteobacteria bacterium]|nr:urate hydroxylase PuuD [Alphaproteobacteria bacterium]